MKAERFSLKRPNYEPCYRPSYGSVQRLTSRRGQRISQRPRERLVLPIGGPSSIQFNGPLSILPVAQYRSGQWPSLWPDPGSIHGPVITLIFGPGRRPCLKLKLLLGPEPMRIRRFRPSRTLGKDPGPELD